MYTMTRLVKPMNVLETGTANGASALAICGAMSQNGFGVLHSVDIRDSTAELVPEKIRSHLMLVRTNGLPSELERYVREKKIGGKNSIFLHDADHSYLGQISDFEIAASQNFDFMISDDVDTSLAFCDLFGAQGKIYFDAPKMIGAVNFARRGE
jgi:cephalosporin hydroxylase